MKYSILIDTDASPDRESGIQKAVNDYNAAHPLQQALTAEEYLQLQLDVVVDSYARRFLDAEINIIAVKFVQADETLRAAVKQTLDIP